jgi:hypothetical protein
MIAALDDDERDVLLAELVAERFGGSIPWAERRRKPKPIPTGTPDRVATRRCRELCMSIDGRFIDDRPIRTAA